MRPALPCEKSGTEASNTARHALRTGTVFLKPKYTVTRESMALLLVENAEHYPEIQWWEAITARDRCQWPCSTLSRQSEKFLIGQSRKFLLTAVRLKDGTNRDEPRGTRLAGMAEASARQEDDAAGGGRANGSQRALGAEAVAADER